METTDKGNISKITSLSRAGHSFIPANKLLGWLKRKLNYFALPQILKFENVREFKASVVEDIKLWPEITIIHEHQHHPRSQGNALLHKILESSIHKYV